MTDPTDLELEAQHRRLEDNGGQIQVPILGEASVSLQDWAATPAGLPEIRTVTIDFAKGVVLIPRGTLAFSDVRVIAGTLKHYARVANSMYGHR